VSTFGERLETVFARVGHLCVGIDPHPFLLEQWDLPVSARGAAEFGLQVLQGASGWAGIVKPQVAFFEQYGSAGYAALEQVIAAARDAGSTVIADAKRGDIGSSVHAYGAAWLTPGSPLEVDALTLSPYQGVGSLKTVFALARATGKGAFVLAATSNPEALEVQSARTRTGPGAGQAVAASIVEAMRLVNDEGQREAAGVSGQLGSFGVVLGANRGLDAVDMTPSMVTRLPILVPGFGEQGASLSDVRNLFGAAAPQVIANLGRSLARGGPAGFAERLRAAAMQLRTVIDQ